MQTTAARKPIVPRSADLVGLCEEADRLIGEAYRTYDKKDFAAASKACLAASLLANKERLSDWANEYGRKSADMNKKACGG